MWTLGQGAIAARTVAEACDGEVVFSMLSDDRAVEAVEFGDPDFPDGIAAAAPVFGRPEAASAARFFVIAAGAPQVALATLAERDAGLVSDDSA